MVWCQPVFYGVGLLLSSPVGLATGGPPYLRHAGPRATPRAPREKPVRWRSPWIAKGWVGSEEPSHGTRRKSLATLCPPAGLHEAIDQDFD